MTKNKLFFRGGPLEALAICSNLLHYSGSGTNAHFMWRKQFGHDLSQLFAIAQCDAQPKSEPHAGHCPSPSPTPTPTSSATVIDRVEEAAWLTCGNCGNDGGTGATAAYFDTLGIAAPSEDGSSTQFTIAATVLTPTDISIRSTHP